jgi:ankyrin repeat protein
VNDASGDIRSMPLPRKFGLWLTLAALLALLPLAVRGGKHLLIVQAIRKDNVASLRGLLRDGGDVNARNGDSKTPLMVAAQAGDAAFVRELIARGADVNAQDQRFNTSLYLAAASGHLEVVRLLRKSGASLFGRAPRWWSGSNTDDTPRKAAKLAGHKEIAELLAKHEHWSKRLLTETQQERMAGLEVPPNPARLMRWKKYLDSGADPNWADNNGNSVVAVAIAGDVDGLRLMLNYHGDPKSESSVGTALMSLATRYGSLPMLELLHQKGAPIKSDLYGGPLFQAVVRGRLDLMRFLLEHGADPNPRFLGLTALGKAEGKVRKPSSNGRETSEEWVESGRPLTATQKAMIAMLKAYGARE